MTPEWLEGREEEDVQLARLDKLSLVLGWLQHWSNTFWAIVWMFTGKCAPIDRELPKESPPMIDPEYTIDLANGMELPKESPPEDEPVVEMSDHPKYFRGIVKDGDTTTMIIEFPIRPEA